MNDELEFQNNTELQLSITRLDPLARNLFDQVARMNRASQRHIFQMLHARFSNTTPRTERETLSAHAIATAKHELGVPDDRYLSSNKYEAWFKSLPEDRRGEFPSGSTIRRAFHNSWQEANSAVVATPIARFSSVRQRAQGKKFTNEEVRAAVRLYASDNGDLLSMRRKWGPWARRKNAEGTRVPICFHTVRHRFATFEDLCDAAGLAQPREMAVRALSDEQIRSVMRQAASEIDGLLTAVAFLAWRAKKLEADPTALIPNHETIANRLGNGRWYDARRAALGEVCE